MRRTVYEDEHEQFRSHARDFLAKRVVPGYPRWEREGMPPREFWADVAEAGLLGIGVPAEYGGLADSNFKHSAVLTEEAQRAGLTLGGLRVHGEICVPYFLKYGTPEQKQRWLPELTSGRLVCALAMSEPGAGSDIKAFTTTATRDGADFILNGTKTFITNGHCAGLMIVAAKTDPSAGRDGITLFAVDADADGLARGKKLSKIGLRTQDLAELFFTNVRVPARDMLGAENRGFEYLTGNLARERLSIAINAQAGAATVLDRTIGISREVVKSRCGQVEKFELASCAAEVDAGWAIVDRALEADVANELKAADAAKVKLYCTELQGRVADRCMRVIGPSAYERGSIGGAWADARVGRIYGGSSEIMKVIVARELGL